MMGFSLGEFLDKTLGSRLVPNEARVFTWGNNFDVWGFGHGAISLAGGLKRKPKPRIDRIDNGGVDRCGILRCIHRLDAGWVSLR